MQETKNLSSTLLCRPRLEIAACTVHITDDIYAQNVETFLVAVLVIKV